MRLKRQKRRLKRIKIRGFEDLLRGVIMLVSIMLIGIIFVGRLFMYTTKNDIVE